MLKFLRISNVIITIAFSILAMIYLIKGNVEYATLCAVMALSAEYAADKQAKREAE